MIKARTLALDILYEVFQNQQYASQLLQNRLDEVIEKDRSFATSLVYTTLQHQLTLRAIWRLEAKRSPRPRLAYLIDLALAQLFFMDKIPEYAVVSETVEMAKVFASTQEVKWVNALLHQMIRKGKMTFDLNTLEGQALNVSCPTWIYQLWSKQYGQEKADKIAKSQLSVAQLYARANPLKIDPQIIINSEGVEPGQLCERALKASFNWLSTDWFKTGQLWIQDQASQYVSEQLDVRPHQKVLDVCSAPGTKAALSQTLMNNTLEIDLIELHEHRSRLIEEQIERLGLKGLHVYTMDARDAKSQFEAGSYDRILVDAPCSGLGVLRRKAEIKYRLKPQDLDALIHLQAELLEAIADLLKVEGMLVYATCTLNKKENEQQIQAFLNKHPNYGLIEEQTLFPDEHESDGFFYAKLKRLA